jgi:hypothetical protein
MDPTPQAPPLEGRQLHFVDIDNLTGGATEDLQSHLLLRQFYDDYTDRHEDDLVFVACCHHSGFAVATAWAGAKIYWRSGKNGADDALLQAFAEASFDNVIRVWLGSGDGIFIPVLESLQANTVEGGHIEALVIALDQSAVHRTIPTVADAVFTLTASRPIGPFARAS